MKAKEAPEKIYIPTAGDEMHYHMACTKNDFKESVEYARTDAFIKKAEKFFTEKFEVEDYNDNIDIDGSPIFNYGRFIDDFKKYIKGE
jgi:hypothetical protein